MNRYFFLLFYFSTLGSIFAQTKGLALIIGNSDYQSKSASLINPKNDAQLVGNTLKSLGVALFENKIHLNLKQREFHRKIIAFTEQLKEGEIGIFYYAGHGMQVNGINYLLPVDEEITREEEVKSQSIEITEILDMMKKANTKANLLIIDACRNNPLKSTTRSKFASHRGLVKMSSALGNSGGTMLFFATEPNQVAQDGDGKNSPFAIALVESIQMPGLKLQEIIQQTIIKTKKLTNEQQHPWPEGFLLEDFYLNPKVDDGVEKRLEEEKAILKAEKAMLEAQLAKMKEEMADMNQNDQSTSGLSKSPIPSISTSAPTSKDLPEKLRKSDVLGSIQPHIPNIKRCSDHDPSLKGTVKVKIQIANTGNVTSTTVENDPFVGTPVGYCVERVVKGIKFPPFSNPNMIFTFPFNLSRF